MTVKLLTAWIDTSTGKRYVVGNLLTKDANTEANLIAQKIADANLTGGTAQVDPVVNSGDGPIARFNADGTALVDPSGVNAYGYAVLPLDANGRAVANIVPRTGTLLELLAVTTAGHGEIGVSTDTGALVKYSNPTGTASTAVIMNRNNHIGTVNVTLAGQTDLLNGVVFNILSITFSGGLATSGLLTTSVLNTATTGNHFLDLMPIRTLFGAPTCVARGVIGYPAGATFDGTRRDLDIESLLTGAPTYQQRDFCAGSPFVSLSNVRAITNISTARFTPALIGSISSTMRFVCRTDATVAYSCSGSTIVVPVPKSIFAIDMFVQ